MYYICSPNIQNYKMARTKHKKIVEVNLLPNVFNIKNGSTDKDIVKYFANENPISLEIGCGHGDYTISLARNFSHRNFIGVDLKGARIWVGAKIALENKLTNAAFLRGNIEALSEFFVTKKIEEIIIPFPDPHIRRASESRRLVSSMFLEIYKSILSQGGKIHLKTDNEILFDYAMGILSDSKYQIIYKSNNIHAEKDIPIIAAIQTKYEKHYLKKGRSIKYISFRLKN